MVCLISMIYHSHTILWSVYYFYHNHTILWSVYYFYHSHTILFHDPLIIFHLLYFQYFHGVDHLSQKSVGRFHTIVQNRTPHIGMQDPGRDLNTPLGTRPSEFPTVNWFESLNRIDWIETIESKRLNRNDRIFFIVFDRIC